MKITGTKKILIILFALICAAAAGLGVLFTQNTPAAGYADEASAKSSSRVDLNDLNDGEDGEEQAEEAEYDERYDEGVLNAIAEQTGIAYEDVLFYVKALDLTANELWEYVEEDAQSIAMVIDAFIESYSAGLIDLNDKSESTASEDDLLAPPDSSTYASGYIAGMEWGIPTVTASKPITNETELWGSSAYTLGRYDQWEYQRVGASPGECGWYYFVWLEPGEEYTLTATTAVYHYVSYGAYEDTANCFYRYMYRDNPDAVALSYYNDYGFSGAWFNDDENGVARSRDPQGKTLAEYQDEYYSDVAPSTDYMLGTSVNNTAGTNQVLKINGDAPSGVYYLRFYAPTGSNNTRYSNTGASTTYYNPVSWKSYYLPNQAWYWITWSLYTDIKVVMLRNNPAEPVMVFDDGVNTDRTEKIVTYNQQPQKISFNGDWGPGLITWTATSSNPNSELTLFSRPAAGTGTQDKLILQATEVGVYTITITSFHGEWASGATGPLTFTFEIKKLELERPTLQDEGDVVDPDQPNLKFVYDTGFEQYLSIFPVIDENMTYTTQGMSEWLWTENGMLTLSQQTQGTYTATVSLRDKDNMVWTTPAMVDDGNGNLVASYNDDITFTFTIGEKLISISPEIINDSGIVEEYSKEVTYNGADQAINIMYVSTTSVTIDVGVLGQYSITDNVMRVVAKDAGTYPIVLTPKAGYVWNDGSNEPRTYTFQIDKMKISAPYLVDDDAVDNVKTVTFGGEVDENGEEWFETLTFANALEARVTWKSLELNQYLWGDTQLVLSARSAGTYNVYFEPKDNYQWDDGVDTPYVTLIIKKLPIAMPYLVNDGEAGATYTDTQKEIKYDFNEHTFYLNVGLQGSVFISYDERLDRVWEPDEELVTFTGEDAYVYEIKLSPTANYCWTDGSSDEKVFVFKITAIALPQLSYESWYRPNGGGDDTDASWQPIVMKDDYGRLYATFRFEDNTNQRVRIGAAPDADGKLGQYSFNPEMHTFRIVDELNNVIENPADYGIVTTTTDGFLNVTIREAGYYYIMVTLKDTNYCWDGTDESPSVVYRVIINPKSLTAPTINAEASAQLSNANSAEHFSGVDGNTAGAVYWANPYVLAINVSSDYKDLVDVLPLEDSKAEDWVWEDNLLQLKATEVGRYGVRLKMKYSSYEWASGADQTVEYLDFFINVVYSPVSGIELYFVDEEDEFHEKTGDQLRDSNNNSTDIKDGASLEKTVIFSEKERALYLQRTFESGSSDAGYEYIPTGIFDQYDLKVSYKAFDTDYQTELDWNETDGIVYYDNDRGLRILFLNAGEYTVSIAPKSNYCWRTAQSSKEAVTFKLVIDQLPVSRARLYDDGDGAQYADNLSQKTAEFSRGGSIKLSVSLGLYPDAYKVVSWEVGENGLEDGMVAPDGVIPDGTNSRFTAEAVHTGTYVLKIAIDNTNNYKWDNAGYSTALEYRLTITKLGLTAPTAWLYSGDPDDFHPGGDNTKPVNNNVEARETYNGEQYYIYFVGDTVQGDDIEFTYTVLNTSNSDIDGGETTVDGAEAYRFSASKVNTYTIKVNFSTADYYWKVSGSTSTSDISARTYTLSITTKMITVPKIEGYEFQSLTDNSHYAYFTYDSDVTEQSIRITGVDFGKLLTGDSYTTVTPSYAFITPSVSSRATTGRTSFEPDTDNGIITVKTIGGTPTVPIVYCLELNIDPDNEAWLTTGSTGDTLTKYYYIVIQKATVTVPSIVSDTMLANQWDKSVTYTGERWSDALVLKDVDSKWVNYTLALQGEMTAVHSADDKLLTVSTDAPAKTYTVVISLVDSDNMEWKSDGSIDDLNFNFIVRPYAVAKPYIYIPDGSTEGGMGVVGLTRTVVYNSESQEIRIANYWDDADDRWMTHAVVSAADFENAINIPNFFDEASFTTRHISHAYKQDINDGLLVYSATNADKYIVRFTLTSNAVWADGSTDPVDVTFVIQKKQYDTPYIYNDTTDSDKTISGTTKTYYYSVDPSGTGVPRRIDILEYNEQIMEFASISGVLHNGTPIADDELTNHGFDGTYYYFEAADAGVYTVTFRLLDFANTRWKFADSETISFTFRIERQILKTPFASNEYLLNTEGFESGKLTVQYDAKRHTVLLENVLTENNFFMTYVIGNDDDNEYTMTESDIAKYLETKNSSGGWLTVKDIYGSDYNGSKKDVYVSKENVLTFGAVEPGTYTVTVKLANSDNFVWADGTDIDLTFTLKIEKMVHAAPTYASDTTKQYDGGYVTFVIQDLYNGIMDEEDYKNGIVSTYVYEKYSITYTGDRTVNTDSNAPFEESWFGGVLTLRFREIGTYTVTVSIDENLTDYVSWRDTTLTSKTFVFNVAKRTLDAEFSFSSTDEKTDASLQTGSTTWPISSPVTAKLTVSGLRVNNTVTPSSLDSYFKMQIYYKQNGGADEWLLLDNALASWTYEDQADGTVTAWCETDLPYGRGNILKSVYEIFVVQVDDDSNYTLLRTAQRFVIIADPVPFEESMIVWQYTASDDPFTVHTVGTQGQDAANRLHLEYKENVTYTFSVTLNAKGMAGFDNANYTDFEDALHSWQVQLDAFWGNTSASDAGNYEAKLTLSVLDPEQYSYDTPQPIVLYYTIDPALYDLTSLSWNYMGDLSFVYDGNTKQILLTGSIDGLTWQYTGTGYSLNQQVYAGTYTTSVKFASSTANYRTPVYGDTSTYSGTFDWLCTWIVNKQKLSVSWDKGTSTSDGQETRYNPVIAETEHSNKVTYIYYKYNEETDDYEQVDSIIREVGGAPVKYLVEAVLKTGIGGANYANNYELVFENDVNPKEFTFGGNDTAIVVHIEIDGKTDTVYTYNGSAFTAKAIIDLNTSNGEISEDDIDVIYYSAVSDYTLPISAPVDPGQYRVVLRLRYSGTTDYYLTVTEFDFTVEKASFDPAEFYWEYTHSTDDGTVTAIYDSIQNCWIDTETGAAVTFVYDGFAHTVKLKSSYANLGISMPNSTDDISSAIAAGNGYVAKAYFTYDETRWNAPTIGDTFTWNIEKQYLDLSSVTWSDYEEYVFTLTDGVATKYSVELCNLPEYLLDKVTYLTTCQGEFVDNSNSSAGKYNTTVTILLDEIDTDNYILGDWPLSVEKYTDWTISRRQITAPSSNGSWQTFDGNLYNLLNVFDISVDWEEYFTIVVEYTDADGETTTVYDGTTDYGMKFLAYNAGTYTLSLALKEGINGDILTIDWANVVWCIPYGAGSTDLYTMDDITATLTVSKAAMNVIGWEPDYESSTVILGAGSVSSSKFLDYEFYEGEGKTGDKATLDKIFESLGGDKYSIAPFIKDAYKGNITLTFATGVNDYYTFETRTLDERNMWQVSGKPRIAGYMLDGDYYPFGNDMLDAGEAYYLYSGSTVTFVIENWTYYQNYLDIWGGDDLTQTEAGQYSITFVLKQDYPDYTLYWGLDGTKIDRSPVTLDFEIKILKLQIPEITPAVSYTGASINILQKSLGDSGYADLLAEYGDYVEITGDTGTRIGNYKLYLKIKEEYGTAVRWDNDSSTGLAGTYSASWSINPIYLVIPELNTDASITYDGEEHSVYEVLKGYGKDVSSADLLWLMQNVRLSVEGSRSINAGTFNAVFSLPSSNYSWVDADGNIINSTDSITIEWTIDKQIIDLSNVAWGYTDDEGNSFEYDDDNPFVYKRVNGQAYVYRVGLINLPEALLNYVTYRTDGLAGNGGSAVKSYTTTFNLLLSALDTRNYEVGELPEGLAESLNWRIVAKEFSLPANTNDWTVFDGDPHEIMKLLGFKDGWENYFDVTVSFSKDGADENSYKLYEGYDYSVYNAYYVGHYKIEISIKSSLNTGAQSVVWSDDGVIGTDKQTVYISAGQLELNITGWNDNDEYSTVIIDGWDDLSDSVKEMFDYAIYEDGKPGVVVDPADVETGVTYVLKFFIKPEYINSSVYESLYDFGIVLIYGGEVVTEIEYQFGKYNFGNQSVVWVPIPVLEEDVMEFIAEELEFKIKDWNTEGGPYVITDAYYYNFASIYTDFASRLASDRQKYDSRFVYVLSGSLKQTAAGEYSVVLRFINSVYLSWYDSSKYEYSNSNLIDKSTGLAVSDTDSLIDRTSKTIKFKITPAYLEKIDISELEDLLQDLDFNGEEQNIRESDAVAAWFDALDEKYGNLISYDKDAFTAAGTYKLVIKLTDPESSCWLLGEKDYVTVNAEGYELKYVFDGYEWQLKYVKNDGNGGYIEYDGNYSLQGVNFKVKYEVEYVPVGTGNDSLLNADGSPKQQYLYDENMNLVYVDGSPVLIEYVTANGKAVRYKLVDGTYIQTDDADEGLYIARYKLENGRKVVVTENVKEYYALFDSLSENALNEKQPLVNPDGSYVTEYIFEDNGSYVLMSFDIGADGKFVMNGSDYVTTVVNGNCDFVMNGSSLVRYRYAAGRYIEASDGLYVAIYSLDEYGNRKVQTVYETDADGNRVIDYANSKITEEIEKTSTDPYLVEWKIVAAAKELPFVNDKLNLVYTGKDIDVTGVKFGDSGVVLADGITEDDLESLFYLVGFDSEYMEVVSGGIKQNAGTYTIVIKLKGDNYYWADTDKDSITVSWTIGKVTVDLSGVTWNYNENTVYTYTRTGGPDGKAEIFHVELINLPEVLKGRVEYTTNGKVGAYAGRDAGNYVTEFRFVVDDANFNTIVIPDTLSRRLEWKIEKRKLHVPASNQTWVVFDDMVHNLLELLDLPEDWSSYYTITVEYASDFVNFTAYEGYNGNKYDAKGVGAYRFAFSILDEINKNATNLNAVWVLSTSDSGSGEDGGESGGDTSTDNTGSDSSGSDNTGSDNTGSDNSGSDGSSSDATPPEQSGGSDTPNPVTPSPEVAPAAVTAVAESGETPAAALNTIDVYVSGNVYESKRVLAEVRNGLYVRRQLV